MSRQTPKEHDVAHRELFTHPELVEDLLRHFVKEPWVEEIDFQSLHRESEISIVRGRGAKIRDVVWSVHFRDLTLYILILVEFQSRAEPVMALRQLIYVASIYQDLYKQKRFTPSGKLPPVLPIVLYNGESRWNAPRSVEEMIEEAPEPLARYQPRMSYFFLDERRAEFELTEDVRNTVAGLMALEQSSEGSEVLAAVSFLVNSLREPKHESLRQAFKELILKVLSTEFAPIAEVFDHPEDPMTTKQRLKNWYDQHSATLRAEGLQEGLQKGRLEGRSEGRSEGQRGLLAKLLRLKFGALDQATEDRLAKASSTELTAWAERVLSAGTLEEIWS